jgi:hypothetical protein
LISETSPRTGLRQALFVVPIKKRHQFEKDFFLSSFLRYYLM